MDNTNHNSKTPCYLLSCEEEQDIPFPFFAHVDLHNRSDRSLQVIPLRFRGVEDLYRVGSAGYREQRGLVKVMLEFPGVQCGAHHDNLNIN